MEGSVEEEMLKLKLSSLEKKQEELHSVIDQKIKMVIDTGNRWLSENADKRTSFKEMINMVDDVLWLVCEASLEIKEWNSSPPSEENGTTSSEAATNMPSLPSADQNMIKPKMSRIKIMEEETIPSLKDQLQTVERRLESTMGELSASHQEMRQREEDFINKQGEQIQKLEKELLSMRDQQTEPMVISTASVAENATNPGRPDFNSFDGSQDDVQKMKDQIQKLELKIENQMNNGEKLEAAIADLFQVKKRVSELSSRHAVGFSAECVYARQLERNVILKGYEIVAGNRDGSFSRETGHFTAPVKGLYTVFLKLQQTEDTGEITLAVDSLKSVGEAEYEDAVNMFSLWACEPNSSDFGLMVRELDVDDILCVKVANNSEMRPARFDCTFSCFLIQES